MRAHVEREREVECCGLLAGRGGIISVIFAAANAAENSSTSYEIAPRDLCRIMREIHASGLELLGIYHSHPRGENFPSSRDIERAYYPETPYFILSLLPGAGIPVRAFSIRDDVVTELSIEVADA